MHSDVGTCLGFQELTLGIQLEFIDEEDVEVTAEKKWPP